MKIVIVSPFWPYPLNAGGRTRIFNLLKAVSGRLDIVFAIVGPEHISDGDFDKLKGLLPSVRFEKIGYSSNIFMKILMLPASLIGLDALLFRAAKNRIYEISKNADILQIEFTQIAHLLPRGIRRSILVVHELRHLLFAGRARQSGLISRMALSLRSSIMRIREMHDIRKYDEVIVMSATDKAYISAFFDKPISIVANGVDTDRYSYKEKFDNRHIYMIGWYGNLQNYDGLLFFLDKIIPRLEGRGFKITVIGRGLDDNMQSRLKTEGVEYAEYAEEVPSGILAVPLRFGGGTRLKILEAMSMGNPVVSTSIGAEGLELKDGEDIVIADSPEKFSEGMIKLADNHGFCEKIRSSARKTAVGKYDWKIISKKLLDAYEKNTGKD